MRTPFIVGNWKMNLDSAGAVALAKGVAEKAAGSSKVRVGVCPAFPYLVGVKTALAGSTVQLGSQNIYFEAKGAFTGEVSAAMALDVGCQFTLIGHS